MSHGFGKKSVKKHCLRVNEQGFISLYAMLLLLIFLCFVTLLVQRAAAYAAVRGLQESYDLFAIHNCRSASSTVQLVAQLGSGRMDVR